MSKIVIWQGDEYRAKVETEYKSDIFFAEVYESAERIIRSIVNNSHARKSKEGSKSSKSKSLITEDNNVIVFCGKRGQGKTSAMKTVAFYMENENSVIADEEDNLFKDTHFYVLETIDPSSLNEDESIVRVLISKMFNKVVELVNEYSKKNQYREYSEEDIRAGQQELLYCFAECFKNVDYSVKDSQMEFGMDNLELLAQLGSSGRLREMLKQLVEKFMAFQSRFGNRHVTYNYMIVQIDDTDMALNGAYKICEDIRNYFSIDNVIVLMATEMEQLSNAIYKQYIGRDKDLISLQGMEEYFINNCDYMTSRYIEKMFPVGHRIQLPKIQDYLEGNFDKVKLEYCNPIRDNEDFFAACNDKCKDIQRQLLSVLYDYTGVIFLIKKDKLHPFLPTTMRELTQFLIMLNSMKKVSIEDAFLSIQSEIENLRYNLELLENYFWNFWGPNHFSEWQQRVSKGVLSFLDKKESNEWIRYIQKAKDEPSSKTDIVKNIVLTIYMNKRFVDMAERNIKDSKFIPFMYKVLQCWKNTNPDGWNLFHYEFPQPRTEEMVTGGDYLYYNKSAQGDNIVFDLSFALIKMLSVYENFGAKKWKEEQASITEGDVSIEKEEAIEVSDFMALRNILANVEIITHVREKMRGAQADCASAKYIQIQESYQKLFECMDLDGQLVEHLSYCKADDFYFGKKCFEKFQLDCQTYKEDFLKDDNNHKKMENFLENEVFDQAKKVCDFIEKCKNVLSESGKSSPINVSAWAVAFVEFDQISDDLDEKRANYDEIKKSYEITVNKVNDYNNLQNKSSEDLQKLKKSLDANLRKCKKYIKEGGSAKEDASGT